MKAHKMLAILWRSIFNNNNTFDYQIISLKNQTVITAHHKVILSINVGFFLLKLPLHDSYITEQLLLNKFAIYYV